MKASIAFLIINIIQKGFTLITTPIYTRLMNQSEYGEVSVFSSWLNTIGIITMFCLSNGIFNNGMIKYKNKRESYTLSMLALSNLITLICLIFVLFFYKSFSEFTEMSVPLILLMFIIYFTQPAFNFWSARKRFEYKYKGILIATIITATISPIVSIFLMYIFPNAKVYDRLFGGEGVFIVLYIVLFIYIIVEGKGRVNTSFWKEAVLFNIPLIPHYLSGIILNNSDRIMIGQLVGNDAAAMYSLAYNVSLAGTIVWNAINSSLIPYTYEKAEKKEYKAISHVTMPIIFLYAGLCFVIIMLAPEVVAVLAPNSYAGSIYVIPSVVGGVFFSSLYFIFANIVYYYRKPRYVMYASVISAILNIILNAIFIPIFGYQAAGYTTLVCYFLQACIDYFAMKKVVGQDIYNISILIRISVIIFVVSIFSRFIYAYPIIRYVLLGVCFVYAIINRKKLTLILNSTKEKR